MSINSFSYLLFLLLTLIFYYTFPKSKRWVILLLSSIIFFLFNSPYYCLLYLICSIVSTYYGTYFIEKCNNEKHKKTALIVTIITIIILLFLLKYLNLINLIINFFAVLFSFKAINIDLNLIAPLGISYYSLTLISYVIDVYRSVSKHERNIFKHALFCCFFPTMISGPIIRYNETKNELFNSKSLNWDNIFQGFIRIIYGLMKKMVIADYLSKIVLLVFSNLSVYSSFYILYGVLCYAIQIYMDFSGCMDIVLGSSMLFGIKLPENFKSPFLSKSLPEFWRRWHITLGTWGKDYIMYPLLRTKFLQRIGNNCRKKYGKTIGNMFPILISIFVLWIAIGIWHGAQAKYILAGGIVPWLYFSYSMIFENIFKKWSLKINKQNLVYKLFGIIKTMFLMCLLWLIVCIPSVKDVPILMNSIFKQPTTDLFLTLPKIRFYLLYCLILVFAVDFLIYKDINPLKVFYKQNIVIKWIIIFITLIIILLFGQYGPNFNPSSFIYGGF